MCPRSERGYTLIEVIVVIALFSVILAFGLAMNLGSVSRSYVSAERDLFVSLLLRGARAEALANVRQTSHGIYIDNTCKRYILFEGTSFTPPTLCTPHPGAVAFTHHTISVSNSGGATIIFTQLSGNVDIGAGTVTISNGTNAATVAINKAGQINW